MTGYNKAAGNRHSRTARTKISSGRAHYGFPGARRQRETEATRRWGWWEDHGFFQWRGKLDNETHAEYNERMMT
jgi:hypothetical protein